MQNNSSAAAVGDSLPSEIKNTHRTGKDPRRRRSATEGRSASPRTDGVLTDSSHPSGTVAGLSPSPPCAAAREGRVPARWQTRSFWARVPTLWSSTATTAAGTRTQWYARRVFVCPGDLLAEGHLTGSTSRPWQQFEQEEGLGLRVGTPFRDNSARPERPNNSRGSERPRASRGGERPRASRGGDADRLDSADSGNSKGPKASRGSARRLPGDVERMVFDDHLERVALEDRPLDSRGGERPKASRSSGRRNHLQSDAERMVMDPPVRPSDSGSGERPRASRGSDRLKSRGGDRSRRESAGEREWPERRTADRAQRYEVSENEIMINQDKPLTLEDWFSNPGLVWNSPSNNIYCLLAFVCCLKV
jgi:hypothetical protein